MNDNAASGAVASREGLSEQTPVMIAATTVQSGVPAEYAWLKKRFGIQEQDWKVDMRSLSRSPQGRTIETFRLIMRGGDKLDVHFDITAFHQL